MVKTIAHELSFISVGLLAGPVSMRTFFEFDASPGKSTVAARGNESHRLCHRKPARQESMRGDKDTTANAKRSYRGPLSDFSAVWNRSSFP
jgi:hypothetical protein